MTKKDFFKSLALICGAPFLLKPTAPVAPMLPEPPWRLKDWLTAARLPILESKSLTERVFIRAILRNEPVTFNYYGGTNFGSERTIHPVMLYRVQGFKGVYVSGFCESRDRTRTFELSRVKLGV